jgi:hypothetical protein
LKNRLKNAGCDLDDSGTNWLNAGAAEFTEALKIAKDASQRPVQPLQPPSPPLGFVESHGVAWKRTADGSYEKFAYCPHCRSVLAEWPQMSGENLSCSKCSFMAPFSQSELDTYRPK